ncbi:MAG: efflux transporter outer membrane subunit [Desulfuromonadaceae bacterium]|nr:efflux transporter outer membrane subunit [Desulfuromonadaceae bacterium]
MNIKNICFLPVVFILSACAVGPDYQKPDFTLPLEWHEQGDTETLLPSSKILVSWWQNFDDSVLTGLINEAAVQSLDLKAAVARIQQARAYLGVEKSQFGPTLDLDSQYLRSRASKTAGSMGYTPTESSLPDINATDNYRAALGMNWEIDLFGRVRRAVEAAHADLQMKEEDLHGVQVALFADVAATYINICALQKRIRVADANILSQGKSLEIVSKRVAAGAAPKLDQAQAESNLASSKSEMPELHQSLRESLNRLTLLLGRYPGELDELLAPPEREIPKIPSEVMVAAPVDVVRQRPDIRSAERLVAMRSAQIGIAMAELYPQLSLAGTFGFESQSGGDLFQSASKTYGLGPSLHWNLFNSQATTNKIKAAEWAAEEAYLQYRNTVLVAMADVQDFISGFNREKSRRDFLGEAVVAYRSSVRYAESLYRSGKTSYQNVLDAQRSLFAYEDRLIDSEARMVQNLVGLYRALGGGWSEN